MEKIIIIGAGPAGMSAAINAKNKNNEVIILEKNNNCGKKLLITGAGKCNYMNDDFTNIHYRSNNIFKIKDLINETNKNKINLFFKNIGIEPKIKNGYYYPMSQTAVSVQNALLLELKNKGIKVYNNQEVSKVINVDNTFIITTQNNVFKCDKLIIAAGSKAAPNTGSDGLMYNILSNLGLNIITPKPALVQLKSEGKFLKEWAGIRIDARIKLILNNEVVKSEEGELQLTDYGISGICTLQISSDAIKIIDKKPHVEVNFVPTITNYDEWVMDRSNVFKNRNIIELFEGIVNYKLLYVLFKKIDISKNYNELTKIEKELIKENLTKFKLPIPGYNDFTKAQVCQGGLSLDEVNTNFEVEKIPNLYVVGEILDVDGDCGGYNIAFAILSGMIAGESAGKK